ncbi:MAG: hypothetical protein GF393_05945, partial [Armatimonadia bacterium]|nr:hypothetical protein [Armatimonadia bacterium]
MNKSLIGAGSVLLALTCICGAMAQDTLEAANMTLRWDQGTSRVLATSVFDPDLVIALDMRVRDGRADEMVALTVKDATLTDGMLTVRYTSDRPLAVMAMFSGYQEGLIIRVTLLNLGDEQQWLEPAIVAEIGDSTGLSVFDGHTVAEEPQERFGDDEFFKRQPICSAWNANASLGLGLVANELRSWFDHVYLPPEGDAPATLATRTRVVLDPGQDNSVSFWAASREGEWGFLESLDAYYETHPYLFRSDTRVDPRVDLGGGQYRAWPVRSDYAPEICRRLYVGWEWCYAPFKRTGDIVGRERFWDYQPAREPTDFRTYNREQFRQWRKRMFERGRECDVVMGFYVPAQVWCEEQLAKEVYPDALIEDPDTRTLFTTPWVTGHDNERLVFPYRTSFGEQSRIDMREVAEELDLRAFAFDTAGGRGKYRGPALPELEGRAWDEDGVYCGNNIAVARLMEFVRTLQTDDGTAVAVIS